MFFGDFHTGAMPIGAPGWPEFASSVASTWRAVSNASLRKTQRERGSLRHGGVRDNKTKEQKRTARVRMVLIANSSVFV